MKTLKKIIYGLINSKLLTGCTNFNSLEVRKSCRSKKQARDAFAKHEVPHAKGRTFINPWKAHQFAKEHGFPLVVKPNVGGFSRGSYFPIRNYRELWKAALLAKIWWPTSVVEQYLEGKNYRVLVANGRVVSVIQRYAPFVTGNGVDTIADLIDAENIIREEMGLLDCMYPLQKSHQTRKMLSKQNLKLDSVPEDGQRVLLFHRISLAPGGVIETIDKNIVAPENARLMQDILKIFGANILGIDVIMEKGIETDYKEQKCILLEVNSRPFVEMHKYPRYGKKDDLSECLTELENLEVDQAYIF